MNKVKSLKNTIKSKNSKKLSFLNWLINRYRIKFFNPIFGIKGDNILDEDWDNLIILDACRYDIFEELSDLRGKLEYRYSTGSDTATFLKNNFINYQEKSKFDDIVYITANPQINRVIPKGYFKVVSVWKDGWDEELETVPPYRLVESVKKNYRRFSDKKTIIHFLQPHYPFIGSKNSNIDYSSVKLNDLRKSVLEGKPSYQATSPFKLLKKGLIDKDALWKEYKENLIFLKPYLEELHLILEGKTIITADHGNLFGERPHIFYPFKSYGHPAHLKVKNLVKVPWFIFDFGKRKKYAITEKEKISRSISNLKKKFEL